MNNERNQGEKCEHCGERYRICWSVPDYIWRMITRHSEEGLLCPICFDNMAQEMGIVFAWSINEKLKDGVLPNVSKEGE